MKKAKVNHVVIFKTGKLHELDMATNALEKAGIPFYRQAESSTGLRFAMPAQPSMGPGTFFSILVPEKAIDDAKATLSELPIEIDVNPDIWHFGPTKEVINFWKTYCILSIALSLVFLLAWLYKTFSSNKEYYGCN